MRKMLILAALLAALPLTALCAGDGPDPQKQWPQWRGPLGNGVAPSGVPPVTWSETENIRWKVSIPGKGLSTPIVWGDRLYLTTAVPFGEPLVSKRQESHGAHDNLPPLRQQRFVVLAIDRRDGSVVWERTVRSERPHESAHVTGSWASSSAATDGERIYASFGSRGLYCLDWSGKVLWERDLGDMRIRHGHGEGSTPALHGDTLVMNWDHQGESFVAALDSRTGKERWRVARDEITSWSSPLVVEHDGAPQVVVAATKRVRSYDLATGKVIWEAGGLSRNVVASPVAGDGLVFVANSYDWQAMLAIRLGAARGDITGTDAVAWSRDRDTPYVPSPLLYGDMLFFLKHLSGILTNVDAATGVPHFGPRRLDGVQGVFASPVGAAGRVYISGRNGATAVVKRGPEFQLLAVNHLDESFSASPAIAGDAIYLRGEHSLYCIAEGTAD
jgi:outer membrane protein assembly factor BamB